MVSVVHPEKGRKYLTKIENGKVWYRELLTHYNIVDGYIFNVIDIKDLGEQIMAITLTNEKYIIDKVPEGSIVCLP